MRTDYQILGLNETASEAQTKTAYRDLAKSNNTDKNPDSKENFQEMDKGHATNFITSLEYKTSDFPKKVHFVWLGGPCRYVANIHAFAAYFRQFNFKVHLWLDKTSNYFKGLEITKENPEIIFANHKIILRHIKELQPRMEKDYSKTDRDYFNGLIIRETNGQVNYASASDLLRLEILRQEGGFYFDTDLQLQPKEQIEKEIKDSSFLQTINPQIIEQFTEYFKNPKLSTPKYGFMAFMGELNEKIVTAGKVEIRDCLGSGNNCVLASVPNHPIASGSIDKILKKYRDLESASVEKRDNHGIKIDFTLFDVKRFKHNRLNFGKSRYQSKSRFTLTVETSLQPVMDTLIEHAKTNHLKVINFFFPFIANKSGNAFCHKYEDGSYVYYLAMGPCTLFCNGSWFSKPIPNYLSPEEKEKELQKQKSFESFSC